MIFKEFLRSFVHKPSQCNHKAKVLKILIPDQYQKALSDNKGVPLFDIIQKIENEGLIAPIQDEFNAKLAEVLDAYYVKGTKAIEPDLPLPDFKESIAYPGSIRRFNINNSKHLEGPGFYPNLFVDGVVHGIPISMPIMAFLDTDGLTLIKYELKSNAISFKGFYTPFCFPIEHIPYTPIGMDVIELTVADHITTQMNYVTNKMFILHKKKIIPVEPKKWELMLMCTYKKYVDLGYRL